MDLGRVDAAQGWRVLAGGFASGLNPRRADVNTTNLTDPVALI